MHQFEKETESVTDERLAVLVLEAVPLVMRRIRAEMRAHRAGLSVPQFRALGYLHRHPGASLSDVAEHLGLACASTSKLIDGLVQRKLVTRHTAATDRRRLTLTLTAKGNALLASARQAAQRGLAQTLARLPVGERPGVARAMEQLLHAFGPAERPGDDLVRD
jgi:DNA-binding MarR family transcriptional regulator